MADAHVLLEPQKEKPRTFRREDIPAKGYTYKDYLSWGDDVRFELLDGIPHMMPPRHYGTNRLPAKYPDSWEIVGQVWDHDAG